MKANYYPKLSPPQLDPQSRNAPRPPPQPQPALVEAHVTERSRPQGVDIITFDSDPDSDIDEFHRKWRA
jgi:hypothetical protein